MIYLPLFWIFTLAAAVDPILTVESGAHTDKVTRLVFARDGALLISASHDKTVRLWDARTGRLLRTLRGQTAAGQGGRIDALAVSPDNRYVAVGGWLAGPPDAAAAVRIHDLNSGEVVGLLRGHKDVTAALAFSPDGKLLASANSDSTVNLWEVARWRLIRTLRGHKAQVHSVAFSPDGERLVTASLDKTLRLWETRSGKSIREIKGHEDHVISAVFSLGGGTIVSSGSDKTLRLWDGLTGASKGILQRLETDANLSASADGGRLLLAVLGEVRHYARTISLPSGQTITQFVQDPGPITATALSPAGDYAATAGGPRHEIFLWSVASGKMTARMTSRGSPVKSVGIAADGRSLAFGQQELAQPQVNFFARLDKTVMLYRGAAPDISIIDDAKESQFKKELDRHGNRQLEAVAAGAFNDLAKLRILQNGSVRREILRTAQSGHRHTCYSFTPDGRNIVSGGLDGILTLYDADNGKPVLNYTGHTGQVWSVATDGRTLVSGSEDQTLRVWDLRTGHNLLTLFSAADGEWVAWTPEGYYTASARGDEYFGWHLNQGVDRQAAFYTASQFQKEYLRPDVVAERLQRREPTSARLAREDILSILPPAVRFQRDFASMITVPQSSWRLKAEVDSAALPISSVRVFVNGAAIAIPEVSLRGDAKRREVDVEVPLRPGTNSIYLAASNGRSTSSGGEIIVRSELPGNAARTLPDLYVLAIGIGQYADSAVPRLNFPTLDAAAVVKEMKAQEGRSYAKVYATSIPEAQATRSTIIRELKALAAKGKGGDTRLIYLAGHAALQNDRTYSFFTRNHKESDWSDDVSWQDLLSPFVEKTGRLVLLVDTCHAAGSAGGGDYAFAIKTMGGDGNSGLFVFSASTSVEAAQELRTLGHGLFTYALLESLREPVPMENGDLFSDVLGVRIRQRMSAIQKGSPSIRLQNPVHFALPAGLPAAPLFRATR